MNLTRRDMLTTGLPMLAATVLAPNILQAATPPAGAKAPTGKAWPARRKEVELAWLKLLGPFPTELPPLQPVLRKVTLGPDCPSAQMTPQQLGVLKTQMAEEAGAIERYHVSFQSEKDDRVTGWLLVPAGA